MAVNRRQRKGATVRVVLIRINGNLRAGSTDDILDLYSRIRDQLDGAAGTDNRSADDNITGRRPGACRVGDGPVAGGRDRGGRVMVDLVTGIQSNQAVPAGGRHIRIQSQVVRGRTSRSRQRDIAAARVLHRLADGQRAAGHDLDIPAGRGNRVGRKRADRRQGQRSGIRDVNTGGGRLRGQVRDLSVQRATRANPGICDQRQAGIIQDLVRTIIIDSGAGDDFQGGRIGQIDGRPTHGKRHRTRVAHADHDARRRGDPVQFRLGHVVIAGSAARIEDVHGPAAVRRQGHDAAARGQRRGPINREIVRRQRDHAAIGRGAERYPGPHREGRAGRIDVHPRRGISRDVMAEGHGAGGIDIEAVGGPGAAGTQRARHVQRGRPAARGQGGGEVAVVIDVQAAGVAGRGDQGPDRNLDGITRSNVAICPIVRGQRRRAGGTDIHATNISGVRNPAAGRHDRNGTGAAVRRYQATNGDVFVCVQVDLSAAGVDDGAVVRGVIRHRERAARSGICRGIIVRGHRHIPVIARDITGDAEDDVIISRERNRATGAGNGIVDIDGSAGPSVQRNCPSSSGRNRIRYRDCTRRERDIT